MLFEKRDSGIHPNFLQRFNGVRISLSNSIDSVNRLLPSVLSGSGPPVVG